MNRESQLLLWLIVMVLCGLALAVGFVLYLFFTYGHPGIEPLSPEEYEALAAEGAPLVVAIEEYRARTGLAPLSLADLPAGSPAPGAWSYDWSPWRYRLFREVPGATEVHYTNDPRWPGWQVEAHGFPTPEIRFEQPAPAPIFLSKDERHRNLRAEFDRRIREFPDEPVHAQGAFTFEFMHGSRDAARRIVLDLARTGRAPWWCARALARLDLDENRDTGAVAALTAMAEQEPGFVSWYMVATVFINTDRADQAAAALEQAAQHDPVEQERVEDGYVLSAFPWWAACWAYDHERFELVLAICDRWQALVDSEGYGDQGLDILRAAALLALGRADEARAPIERAIEANARLVTSAKDLAPLKQAIERADRGYRWTGGREHTRIEVFTTYR